MSLTAKCEQNSNAQVPAAIKQSLLLNESADLHEILHGVQGKVTLRGDVSKKYLRCQKEPFYHVFLKGDT